MMGVCYDKLILVKLFFFIYYCGMFDIGVSFWGYVFFVFILCIFLYIFFWNDLV